MQNKVFIVSDTHFFHANCIKYTERPFLDKEGNPDVELMNKTLIKNWNNTVSKSDKVFHLGDFSFGHKNNIREIVPQLNGYKILIKGNHDKRHSSKFFLEAGFDEVYNWPIIYCQWYILSHEPIEKTLIEGTKFINLHGHLHQNKVEGSKNHINSCIELHKYTPILFNELIRK